MSESVGVNAYTIHKYLKWNKETGKFQVDEFNKTRERIVIVDEASMIDIFLFSSLLKGLSLNVKLLLIGDANQLPSIGPGDILNDLINNKSIKSKKLQTIYRVKEGSYLTYLANDIKNRVEFESFDNSYDDFRFIESSDDYIKLYLSEICREESTDMQSTEEADVKSSSALLRHVLISSAFASCLCSSSSSSSSPCLKANWRIFIMLRNIIS